MHTLPTIHVILNCGLQAKNFVNYLRIIHRILAPGGVWINLGPLLWHWENSDELSIELTLDEVKELAQGVGFELSVC
jgi:carnosine N-methyltransferase